LEILERAGIGGSTLAPIRISVVLSGELHFELEESLELSYLQGVGGSWVAGGWLAQSEERGGPAVRRAILSPQFPA
jgi:hypothetical protein